MHRKKALRIVLIFLIIFGIFTSILISSAWFSNKVKNVKGELIGNHFTIDFFDNFGNNILTIDGKKVGLDANYVQTRSISSDGAKSTNYELSSVITLTVDGNQVAQTTAVRSAQWNTKNR